MKKFLALVFSCLLLVSTFLFPVLAAAEESDLAYPALDSKAQYYQTTFPEGLRYSPGWYGTFTHAPKGASILLFDDDSGICLFSMPNGVVPSGEQGGTVVEAITVEEANAILKSYSLAESAKPFDSEIKAVMEYDHHFLGAWAGDKLAQKWGYDALSAPTELTSRQLDYKAATEGLEVKSVDLERFDPDRFWILGSGDWSDTAHWSAFSGGAGGASVPTNADNVFFDINSFGGAAQTVTVDVAATCLAMDWTGATNSPAFALGGNHINIFGNVTFIAAMTFTAAGGSYLESAGPISLTSNGLTIPTIIDCGEALGSLTLADNLTANSLVLSKGAIDTNGKTVNANIYATGATAKTLTLGSSVINCGTWRYDGTNLTLTANTATINVSGALFTGGGLTAYNTVNLTGATCTISGDNTFVTLALPPGTTQTITFTDGSVQTATTFTLSGSAGHVHTLQGTGVGGWGLNDAAGINNYDYISVSRSTAAGGATFNANGASINGGNNVGWNFPLTVTTQAVTGTNTLNGTLVDMGGTGSVNVSFQYGLTVAYGQTTPAVAQTAPGTFSATATNSYRGTWHCRAVATTGGVTSYGADQTFTIVTDIDRMPGMTAFLSILPLLLTVALVIIIGGLGLALKGDLIDGAQFIVSFVISIVVFLIAIGICVGIITNMLRY